MKSHVLIIGVGGTGSASVDLFYGNFDRAKKQIEAEYTQKTGEMPNIYTIVCDTNQADIDEIKYPVTKVPFACTGTVGDAVKRALGARPVQCAWGRFFVIRKRL